MLWIGVPLFFVISGYCIAATADRTRLRGSSLTSYFARRFRRIYPPLWIAIVLSVLFFVVVDVMMLPGLLSHEPWAQLRPWWFSPWQWFGNITLTETWRHYVVGGPRGHFPGQAWTLCYEEQFYAVVGLLLLLPRHFFRGATIVTGLTLVTLWVAQRAAWNIEGFFFDGNWLMFAAGILVYYTSNYGRRRHQQASVVILLASALLSGYLPVRGSAVAFSFAAALVVLKPFDRSLVSLAAIRPITVCGEMCYSLYLVHQYPVRAISAGLARGGAESGLATLLVTVPLCVLAAVGVGWLFHLHVERRFLNAPSTDLRGTARMALTAQVVT
jgi:peptidoglycan/LPS O-acetylase OafA/YrhL